MPIDKNKIIETLKERGAIKPCHRCGGSKHTLLDGYFTMTSHEELTKGIVLGGPMVPLICLACENCGAITSHAIGGLGLLPKPIAKKKKEE